MAATQRPAGNWCGASCHDAAELARARELGVDFVVLGPVAATPSHAHATTLMRGMRGTTFDPAVLDAFFSIEAGIVAIAVPSPVPRVP